MTLTEVRPRQLEDVAIEYVVERERGEGREARDIRGSGMADLESGDRVIEVKACGTSSRGNDLWLECSRYITAKGEPERFWLYLVENMAQGDPDEYRLIRIGGSRLQELLEHAKERRFWTVPVPVRVYDEVACEG